MATGPTAFEIVWRSPWVRAVCYVVLIGFALFVLKTYWSGYVFALQVAVVGFGLAYVFNPLVTLLGRARVRRSFAVIIIYILLLFLLLLGSVLVADVIRELSRLTELIPSAFNNISTFSESVSGRVSGWLSGILERAPDLASRLGIDTSTDDLAIRAQAYLEGILSSAIESITRVLNNILTDGPSVLLSGATTILSTTLQVVLILLASAYFLYDFPKFTESFRRVVPVRYRSVYSDLTKKADMAVGGYLRGQLLITLFIGVFIYIGLSIINVPLALAISFLAAIFNLVPYLGPIIGVIPAVLLGFTVSPLTALWAVVIFILANQIEGNVLAPFILSKSTNLHPVTVLLAILAGAGMFGLLGALAAVPVVALLKVVLDEYLFQRSAYQDPVPLEVMAAGAPYVTPVAPSAKPVGTPKQNEDE